MLIELLQSAAKDAPAAPFLVARGREWTYAEVLAASERIAGLLAERSLGRVGCRLANGAEPILLWFAAAWLGAEPCILSLDANVDETEELATRLAFDAVVADEPLIGVRWIPAADLFEATAASTGVASPASDPSVVILTTGTTGQPKGVRYRWASLIAQVRTRPEAVRARWLLAYNLNHFAGVQMFLHALAHRATVVIPPSPSPSAALSSMENLAVTHVSATPTFWRFLLAQIPPERAHRLRLEQITLGAEAAPPDLIAELRRRFPQARVSQVFAATEVGSCLAVSDGLPGLPASILDRADDADVRFRIVDGELLIRARHGMDGYLGDDGSTAVEWRATGDLVEVRGDRIHFVGRKTETINVGGVKVHPLPIEERAQAVSGVRLAHAYGRKNPVTGEIVALDVVVDEGADTKELEGRIRSACGSLPRAAQPRVIRFVESIDTRNQKVVRRKV